MIGEWNDGFDWDNPLDVWSNEPTEKTEHQKQDYNLTLDLYREFSPATICLLTTRVAIKILRISYFELIFIGSAAFLATAIVRKIFQEYTLLSECERIATIITRRWPYLHVAVGVVATLFVNDLPFISIPLIAGVGVLSALAFRVKWLSAVTGTCKNEQLSL